ncbi:hypothetical protein [Hyalangium sp.]|uniref:hypothetical protein n=1 Tax=Hyalangium sp. TaxID=2028555 RepID=UPI002D640D16|nr:hypothetical protein [Hyalangium sp.]HYI00046.1 hypothetical protein [Hyalangium sp.]
MSSLRNVLVAVAVVGLGFSTSEAEARFGKRSSSSDSDKKEEKKKDKEERDEPAPKRVHEASAVSSRRTHDASPVGSSRPPPPPPERVIVVEPAPPPTYYVEPAYPAPVYYASPAPEVHTARKDTIHSALRMGLEGGPTSGGTRANLFLAFEGEYMGLEGRLTGLSLSTDDGTGGTDTISVTGVNLTYAVLANERVRWRVEAGFSSAHAPDLTVVGPSLGTSFDARLGGSLDLELRLQGTPFPYRQMDAQAGLAVKLYPWVLRAGWRTLMLDDAGLVDGEVHKDVFHGPYLGVGLFF